MVTSLEAFLRTRWTLVRSYWSQKWKFFSFVRWSGRGRLTACLTEMLPKSVATHVPLLEDCGNHQWTSDLVRHRFSDQDDKSWVEGAVARVSEKDRCLFCEVIKI